MRVSNRQSGLTFVETVIYVAIIVLILVGMVNVILFTTRSFGELQATRDLKNSARIALERMTREIREADTITVGASIFDAHPGELVLEQDGVQRRFYVVDGVLKLDEGGTYAGDLTLADAQVTGFVLRHMDGIRSDAVRVELSLKKSDGSGDATTFYGGSVVRSHYINQ